MEKKNVRVRAIADVPEETWRLFSSQAKMVGLTQAEFLRLLMEVYLNKKNGCKDEKKTVTL